MTTMNEWVRPARTATPLSAARIAQTLRGWRRRRARCRRMIRELETYSDGELAVFGLSRVDIPAFARRAVRSGG